MRQRTRPWWRSVLLAPILFAVRAEAADLLIRDARLIDGTGAPPRAGVSVLVRRGRILEIGGDVTADGVPVIDARGGTLLPGLIDSHVHLTWGPGSALEEPAPTAESWPRTWGKFLRHYLRAYLACGITTVLDTGANPGAARAVQRLLAGGEPGPRYLTLGPFLTPPGGYASGAYGSVSSSAELEAKLDLAQSVGAVGVKVSIESGFSPLHALPLHPPEMLEVIRAAAARRALPIYVHATEERHQLAAVELGAHALVHAILPGIGRSAELSQEFVDRMAESGTYQMTTLSIIDSWRYFDHPERLDDPLLELAVPRSELGAARDPAVARASRRAVVGGHQGWLPGFLRDVVGAYVLNETAATAGLQRAKRAIRRLHGAGVPIVVGSDTVYDPAAVHSFHGPTSLREMELLAEAGLAPEDVLAAATRTPARMLGLSGELGTIEVGKRADLIIVRDDPLADIRALRTIRWTVRDGVALTPEEWMRLGVGGGTRAQPEAAPER